MFPDGWKTWPPRNRLKAAKPPRTAPPQKGSRRTGGDWAAYRVGSTRPRGCVLVIAPTLSKTPSRTSLPQPPTRELPALRDLGPWPFPRLRSSLEAREAETGGAG
ncbi:hypothetical protein GCM10009550_55730 [Actinocorallia libanotica]|uniref:Uncharacterized protein n=1 Tax=Actinocorallia libanotica TaxID=46162 RepID=A0ABP4C777_9ACTN